LKKTMMRERLELRMKMENEKGEKGKKKGK
jgi:hypothetical protein